MKKFIIGVVATVFIGCISTYAVNVPISLFPLDNYNQNVDYWLNPNAPDYNSPLISEQYQQMRLSDLYNHDFDSGSQGLSPWSATYINKLFSQTPDLQTEEKNLVTFFSNANKKPNEIGYGENFRPHTQAWVDDISNNMNLQQFASLKFDPAQRGIAIANLAGRILPTNDVHFYDFTLPGQGYPFDNLQISAIWAGTPLYIVGQSLDHAWSLVITPNFIAWVQTNGIIPVDNNFITTWQQTAEKSLAAITHTTTAVGSDGHYYFRAYVGSVFPETSETASDITVLIPTVVNNKATTASVKLNKQYISTMPLAATPHNFANIIKTQIGRPYGWGGMYFYNDCSAETKSLFAPFGIWLPRHSSAQVTAGKMVDKSSDNVDQRMTYLMQNGHKLMTIVYIGGHVFLYIGNYNNPNNPGNMMAMTYQNVWGLSPVDYSRRAVIGSSVLFPLLKTYPEDPTLNSLANKKYFQVAFLDQWAVTAVQQPVTLKSLMYPEWMLTGEADH